MQRRLLSLPQTQLAGKSQHTKGQFLCLILGPLWLDNNTFHRKGDTESSVQALVKEKYREKEDNYSSCPYYNPHQPEKDIKCLTHRS